MSVQFIKEFPYELYCELRGRVEETKILKISKFKQNERRSTFTYFLYPHEVTSYRFLVPNSQF